MTSKISPLNFTNSNDSLRLMLPKGFPETAVQFAEQQLAKSTGLILLTGMNGSGVEGTMESLALGLVQDGRKIFGIGSSGVWSPDEPPLAWPKGADSVTVNTAEGITYADAIDGLRGTGISALLIDRIDDFETAARAINFSSHQALTITSVRGADAFSAVEWLLDQGISRAQLFSTLRLIIATSRNASGRISYEVIGLWPVT